MVVAVFVVVTVCGGGCGSCGGCSCCSGGCFVK